MSGPKRRSRARVDPELRRQLARASASGPGTVEAVLRLREPVRRSAGGALAAEPGALEDLAQSIVARVAQELGSARSEYDFNVFPNLGYCVIAAPAGFVERVLCQPEVASASANRRG